jgi:hypothetical protein
MIMLGAMIYRQRLFCPGQHRGNKNNNNNNRRRKQKKKKKDFLWSNNLEWIFSPCPTSFSIIN